MKNKDFFYLQYDKINWPNQETTKINSSVNSFIIKGIITKKQGSRIKLYDIGLGIGFFMKMLYKVIAPKYKQISIEGCEPSKKNYQYFTKHHLKTRKGVRIKTQHVTFLNAKTATKFDFITAIYVFPHFLYEELQETVHKIHTMLEPNGQFILVVANESYLERKLESMKDLSIEKSFVGFDNKQYKEVLHYSDIPDIGKVIDYNREEQFYLDIFRKYGFKLAKKNDLNDNGFICTVFVFQKQ